MSSEGGGQGTYTNAQVSASKGSILGTGGKFTSAEQVKGASDIMSAGFNLLGSYQKGRMAEIQGNYEAQQAEFNAKLVAIQREDMLDIAEDEALSRQDQVANMLGLQKTTLAARGIEADGDLAQLIADEERRIGADDVLTIKTNARKQAFGLELQEQDLKAQARFSRIRGKSARKQGIAAGWSGLGQAGFSTILSGATG